MSLAIPLLFTSSSQMQSIFDLLFAENSSIVPYPVLYSLHNLQFVEEMVSCAGKLSFSSHQEKVHDIIVAGEFSNGPSNWVMFILFVSVILVKLPYSFEDFTFKRASYRKHHAVYFWPLYCSKGWNVVLK